jgi:methyl halide transferase
MSQCANNRIHHLQGCGKGYDVVALALHGFDVYGLEVSEKACATARRYVETELAEPSEHNYHDLDAACAFSAVEARNVTIIAGDFFQKDWEPQGFGGFDLIYDYTVRIQELYPTAGEKRKKEPKMADRVW